MMFPYVVQSKHLKLDLEPISYYNLQLNLKKICYESEHSSIPLQFEVLAALKTIYLILWNWFVYN